jgi:pimeloyl-ACP methyl ester carboxylesterase
VSVPTLYVWGDRDVALSRWAAERTARYVSGPYRFLELAGVSHWIPEEAPDALTDALLPHLSAHPVV